MICNVTDTNQPRVVDVPTTADYEHTLREFRDEYDPVKMITSNKHINSNQPNQDYKPRVKVSLVNQQKIKDAPSGVTIVALARRFNTSVYLVKKYRREDD